MAPSIALLLLLGIFTLSSCSGPDVVQDTEKTLDELGKERKISDDIQITPQENNKVKMQF